MPVTVDIADRLYDYTDEEKAAGAVSEYQIDRNLDDRTIVEIWENQADPRRQELEQRIFDAIELNGSAKRATDAVPGGISLLIEEDVT